MARFGFIDKILKGKGATKGTTEPLFDTATTTAGKKPGLVRTIYNKIPYKPYIAGGVGLSQLYDPSLTRDIVSGIANIPSNIAANWQGRPAPEGISNLELQQGAYNPMQSYDTFADEYARVMSPSGMSQADMLNLINQYATSGRVSGGTGRGGSMGNEYFKQYRQSFNAPGSSLVPVSGEEQLAAARLQSQGKSLQDYLKLVDAAYGAAGSKANQAYRNQVANAALAAYLGQESAQQKMYQDIMKARLQASANYGMIPEYQIGENERLQAEELAAQTGMSLQDAVNALAKKYYYQEILNQAQYLK